MEAKVTIQKTQDVPPILGVLDKQPKNATGSQEDLLLNLIQLLLRCALLVRNSINHLLSLQPRLLLPG